MRTFFDGKILKNYKLLFPKKTQLKFVRIACHEYEIFKIKDMIVPRYFYSENEPNIDGAKKLFDNLWVKNRKIIMDKHQAMGLANSKYIVKEL